jgi:hypothetical protein
MDNKTIAALIQAKSTGLAVVLSLFFGGLGLLYATIPGGIIMSIITVLVWILGIITLGIGLVLVPFVHFVCIIWAVIAVKKYNTKLLSV